MIATRKAKIADANEKRHENGLLSPWAHNTIKELLRAVEPEEDSSYTLYPKDVTDAAQGLIDKLTWYEEELAVRYIEGALENLWDAAYSTLDAMHGEKHFAVLDARQILQACLDLIVDPEPEEDLEALADQQVDDNLAVWAETGKSNLSG